MNLLNYFPILIIIQNLSTMNQGMFNIIDYSTGFKIDFFFRKNTEYFNIAFSRRKKIHEFNTDIWVITIEDLIIAKLIWTQKK